MTTRSGTRVNARATKPTPQPTDEGPLGWSLLSQEGLSELQRKLALLIVLLFTVSLTAASVVEDHPQQTLTATGERVASQRPFKSLPDDTDPTTTAVVPTAPKAPQVTWPRAPQQRASRGCNRSLEQIAQAESGGDYTAQNPHSTASGKYQVLDSTWDGYGGYARAKDAPPAIQEQHARELYALKGSQPWRASGC